MTEDRALRDALSRLVAEPAVPGTLAERVATAYAVRRRRRTSATVVAVAFGVGVLAVAPALVRSPRAEAPPFAAQQTEGAVPRLNARLVAGSGTVYRGAGKPTLLCRPYVRSGWPDPDEHPPCRDGIPLVGVDLDALSDRTERDGAVWGQAWLRAWYDGKSLNVEEQGAPRREEPVREPFRADCPVPDGGWPKARGRQTPDLEPADAYAREHPGTVVNVTFAWPSPDAAVIVVAAHYRARVDAALRPAYGDRLCVVESRYTKQQIEDARKAIRTFQSEHGGLSSWGGIGAHPDGQPAVGAHAHVPTPELAEFLDTQPEGLFRIEYWLAPVS